MRTVDEQKQLQARALFFQTDKSQGEIAAEVGISDKTLYLWTREGDWRRLRSASKFMPSLIIDNFYAQVQELNDEIRSRQPGKRYPSLQEAEIFRKMMLTIDRSKKKASQGEHMELMQKFLQWISPQDNELLQTLTTYADRFLKTQSTSGFYPFDMEYDEEQETPLSTCGEGLGVRSLAQDTQPEEYYTEPTEEETQETSLASLRGTNLAERSHEQERVTQQSHNNTEEPNEIDQPNNTSSPSERSGKATPTQDQSELFSRLPLTDKNDQPEIIGNNNPPRQQNEDQPLIPENPTQNNNESVIINQPEISNDPRDIYKGLSAGEAWQKYLALKKQKEQTNTPEENIQKEPPKEEAQIFSIGEKIFTMRVKK